MRTMLKGRDEFAEMARHVGPDIASLARLGAQGWTPRMAAIAASGVPTMLEDNGTYPNPFGAYISEDGQVVVDDFTSPISNIPEILREFTIDNEGYFIERIFNAPGWTVQGGAIRYAMNRPGLHFLTDGTKMKPRAPGAEAPILAGPRQRDLLAYIENLSGRIEIPDEYRTDNVVTEVQAIFRQTANSFADQLQDIGEATLDALVESEDRILWGGDGTFTEWDESPVVMSTTAMPFPGRELARVKRTFKAEKGGVQPDTAVWSLEDAELFDNIYGDRGDAVLRRYGITNLFTSIRRTAGQRLYLRSGQVGTLAWAKPFGDPEYERAGIRKTDVYIFDARYAFVANGADAVLEVRDEVES